MRSARIACVGLAALGSLLSCTNLSSLTSGGGPGPADAASGGDGPATDGTLDTSRSDTSPQDALAADTSRADASFADSQASDGPPSPGDASDGGCTTDPCVMAVGLNHPGEIVSDSSRVYWTELGTAYGTKDGSVKSCPVSGCGAGPTVIASGFVNPRGLAVDGSNVYFATATYGPAQGGIWSCPLTGGALPRLLAPASIAAGVAIDQSYVYWVDSDMNTISRVPKTDGGPLDVLYDAASHALPVPEYCAVDGTNVYVSDSTQRVLRVPIGGGEPVVMAVGVGIVGDSPIAIDQASIYYVAGGQICKAPKTTTDGGPPIATNFAQLLGLALDGDAGELYWADFGTGMGNSGTIGKVGTNGGAVQLGTQLVAPESVTVSGSHLFWLSNGTGVMANSTAPNTGALTRQAK